MVLRAGGVRRTDLGGLLPEARHPECELALPLQVGAGDIEPPRHGHVAVEPLQRCVFERLDEGEIGLGLGRRTELALGGQQLDRRRGEFSLAGWHRSTLPARRQPLLVKPVQAHPES